MGRNFCRAALGTLVIIVTVGCASQNDPPAPGDSRGGVPDLRGQTVLVYPVQLLSGVPSGTLVDEELAHAFRTRGPSVDWVFPPEAQNALRRSPGMQSRIQGLPVSIFLQTEVQRIGDPLYGEVHRLATLVGADVALIPVQLAHGETGTYQVSATLIRVLTGHVLWFGVVEGAVGEPGDPAALASVAESLGRALLPLG